MWFGFQYAKAILGEAGFVRGVWVVCFIRKNICPETIVWSQNWWFVDPRPLLYGYTHQNHSFWHGLVILRECLVRTFWLCFPSPKIMDVFLLPTEDVADSVRQLLSISMFPSFSEAAVLVRFVFRRNHLLSKNSLLNVLWAVIKPRMGRFSKTTCNSICFVRTKQTKKHV